MSCSFAALRCAFVLLTVAVLAMAAAACSGDGQAAVQSAPAAAAAQPAVAPSASAYPPFPAEASLTPAPAAAALRRTSADADYPQDGAAFIAESSGSLSYADPAQPGAHIFVPAKGGAQTGSLAQHLAWGIYRVPALTAARPVRLSLEVAAAPASAGGTPDLPCTYYVGLSDYSTNCWDWRGPFSGAAELVLNGNDAELGQIAERYVSSAGDCYFTVLVDAQRVPAGTGNPAGLCAARLQSATLTTSSDCFSVKPHFTAFASAHAGGTQRSPSALDPAQFITLAWDSIGPLPASDILSAAMGYRIYRQPYGGAASLIGEANSAAGSFIDPVDCKAAAPAAVPGTTYWYFLEPHNFAGAAHRAHTALTMPILAPLGVQATDNAANTAVVTVSWQAVEGALHYEVYRNSLNDSGSAGLLGSVAAPALSWDDGTAVPAEQYFYWVRALGRGDGDAANGVEPGSRSPFSLGDDGLRAVALSVACTTGGVGGSGTAADRYLLGLGGLYAFSAIDQAGTDRSLMCAWSVEPAASGSFAAWPPNELTVLPGAALFSVKARYAYLSYEWESTVYCAAQ